MSELIWKELVKNKNKDVLIFSKIGYRYECKILEVEKDAVKFYDYKMKKNKTITLDTIGEVQENG